VAVVEVEGVIVDGAEAATGIGVDWFALWVVVGFEVWRKPDDIVGVGEFIFAVNDKTIAGDLADIACHQDDRLFAAGQVAQESDDRERGHVKDWSARSSDDFARLQADDGQPLDFAHKPLHVYIVA